MKFTKIQKVFQFGRFLVFALVLLIFVIGGLFWFWKKHKRAIVKLGLEEMVAGNSKGVYQLKIGQLNFDEEKGWVRLKDIKLDYDSTRFALMKSSNESYPILIRMSTGIIDIDGISSGAEIKEGKFRGHTMLIRDPEIELIYTEEHKVKSIPTKEEIYKQITAGMDVEMDSILIKNASISTRNFGRGDKLISADSIMISLIDVKVNDAGIKDSSRLFFSKSFQFGIGSAGWNSKNGLYRYQIGNIQVDATKKQIRAGELSIVPRVNKKSFFTSHAGDPMEIYCRNMQIDGVDIALLVGEQMIADQLRIGNGSVRIWHEPGGISSGKKIELPQTQMTHTPFKFRIKNIIMSNGRLEYRERSSITGKTGFIHFDGMTLAVKNFCNDLSVLKYNPEMRMDLSARFQNKLSLRTNWVFHPGDPSGSFSLSGNTGRVDGTEFNDVLEAMGPSHLDKGYVNGIEFSFNGSDASITGQVKFLYQDLKIQLLEEGKDKGVENKKKLTSFLANILIKNDNPKGNKPPRIASVQLQRDKTKSIFFFVWKALLSGLKQGAGIKEKKK